MPPHIEGLPTASSQTVPVNGCFPLILSLLVIDQRLGPTRRMLIPSTGGRGLTKKKYTRRQRRKPMREGSMRALWIVAALIGIAILIFAHATVLGIVVGIAFLGLAVFLYRRPLVHRIGLSHR